MLGFLSLTRAGRRFELAQDSDAASMSTQTVKLAKELAVATEIAVPILRRELAGMTAVAA
jgi:hypothetical protein